MSRTWKSVREENQFKCKKKQHQCKEEFSAEVYVYQLRFLFFLKLFLVILLLKGFVMFRKWKSVREKPIFKCLRRR